MGAILVTGATGLLGGLAARALAPAAPLVLPVRSSPDEARVRLGLPDAAFVPLPPDPVELAGTARRLGVTEIVHCAGCLRYFDEAALEEGNVRLTAGLLRLAETLGVDRFTYVSTAFSCGYATGRVREAAHADPASDPNAYTATKRRAERLVADSGVPWVVLRPSIVVGDSRDGTYGGKPYGVYQLWGAAERVLSDRWHPTIHAVAPRVPLHLLHQDAFQAALVAARALRPGTYAHLVSRADGLPTVRDAVQLWVERVARPREVIYYDRLDQVPRADLDRGMQLWLEHTSPNVEISTWRWEFETAALDGMRRAGLGFVDATATSLATCQDRFVRDSRRIARFLDRSAADRASVEEVRVVEATAGAG